MQIIIISADNTGHKHWHLSRTKLMLLVAFLLSITIAITVSTMNYIKDKTAINDTVDSKFFPTARLLTPKPIPSLSVMTQQLMKPFKAFMRSS